MHNAHCQAQMLRIAKQVLFTFFSCNKYDTVVGEAQQFSSDLMALGSVYTI